MIAIDAIQIHNSVSSLIKWKFMRLRGVLRILILQKIYISDKLSNMHFKTELNRS